VGLAIPAATSVLVSFVLMSAWRGSMALAITEIRLTVSYAVVGSIEPDPIGAWEWIRSQAGYWNSMFTLPVSLLALAALPLAIARCRRPDDTLSRLALAMLAPPALNVIAFSRYAHHHEFWWYYAVPSVILLVVILLREVSRLRVPGAHVLACATVLLLGAHGVERTLARHAAEKTTRFRDLGRELNTLVRPDDLLLYPATLNQACFYLLSQYVEVPGPIDLAGFHGIRTVMNAGKLRVRRVVALVPDGRSADVTSASLPRMRELGVVRRIEATHLAAEHPALASFWPDKGLWILTIE
jgi:hypothetical protein